MLRVDSWSVTPDVMMDDNNFPPLQAQALNAENKTEKGPLKEKMVTLDPKLVGEPSTSAYPRPNAWTLRPRIGTFRSNQIENPYLEGVDPTWGQTVSDEEIQQIIEEINRIDPAGDLDEAKRIPWEEEDERLLKIRYNRLKRASVILNVLQAQYTRDDIKRWLDLTWGVHNDGRWGRKTNKLRIELPWGGEAVQEVRYQDIPNACFRCKKPGHQARDCPVGVKARPGIHNAQPPDKEHREASQRPNKVEVQGSKVDRQQEVAGSGKDEEFVLVKKFRPGKHQERPNHSGKQSSNRSSMLSDLQKEEDKLQHTVDIDTEGSPRTPAANKKDHKSNKGETSPASKRVEDSQQLEGEPGALAAHDLTSEATKEKNEITSLVGFAGPSVDQIIRTPTKWADIVEEDDVMNGSRIAKGMPPECCKKET
ncbi:hypothetical protein R1sor_021889 [Riccia sorocarpa]|uniref:CCHC-type domain-containing protein n=1 Tax=Riccia sorocarpa TaxID=122646 RepID=A0ABD3GIB8_9MARC